MTYWALSAVFCGAWWLAASRASSASNCAPWLNRWLWIQAVRFTLTTLMGRRPPDWYWLYPWTLIEACSMLALLCAAAQMIPRKRLMLAIGAAVLGAPLCIGLKFPGPPLYAEFLRAREYLWLCVTMAFCGHLLTLVMWPVCTARGARWLWAAFAGHALCVCAISPAIVPTGAAWLHLRSVYQWGSIACCLVWAGWLQRGATILSRWVDRWAAGLPRLQAEAPLGALAIRTYEPPKEIHG